MERGYHVTSAMARFIQQALTTNNWNEVIVRAENAVLQCIPIESKLLELIPIVYIQSSPLLQKARGEELVRRGDLLTAREEFLQAIKGLAAQTLRKTLLSALSQLAVVNLRMGLIHEASPIVRFLHAEWDSTDQDIGGDVAYALARGLYVLGDEAGHSDAYYRYAIDAYDRDGETERGSLSLFELLVRTHADLSSQEWEDWMTEFVQRIRRRQVDSDLLGYLKALRLLFENKPEQAEHQIKDCKNLSLPHPYQAMASCLQLRIAIRTGNLALAAQLMADMEKLQPESDLDLEWQFEWAIIRFEWAVCQADWTSAGLHGAQVRSIFKLGLPPRSGVWVEWVYSVLEERKAIDQGGRSGKYEEAQGLWRVNLFGTLKFVHKDQIVHSIHWKRKKTKELFIYLLLQPGYSAPREQVAEALYANYDPDKMNNQLYVAAHQLKSIIREYLGFDGGVVIKEGMILLKDGLIREVDVEQYQALVRVGDQLWPQERELADQMYEKSAQLYEEIIADVQYMDWLELVREQLRTKHCEILRRLGRYAAANGRYERAEVFFRQWIALSSLNEEPYQELMRVLRDQGKQSEAEFLFRQLEQHLRRELGVAPLSETRSIIWR